MRHSTPVPHDTARRLPGIDELLVPGERGQRRHRDLTARGMVPLARASWQLLATSCESLAVPLPAVLDH